MPILSAAIFGLNIAKGGENPNTLANSLFGKLSQFVVSYVRKVVNMCTFPVDSNIVSNIPNSI